MKLPRKRGFSGESAEIFAWSCRTRGAYAKRGRDGLITYRNMHTFLKSTYQVDIVWRVQITARQKAKSSHFSLIRVKEQPQNGALCPRNSHIKVDEHQRGKSSGLR
ncbi:uncharacterized protein LOC122567064 isoform X2 [Bombus pyrosoma]|uniref:uncharacterized protein LOC122567064 isoform X2 n=1 Tax=Bombus pyrosoma TaxID=396416 RepID=UPI001CB9D471|nr:uncharacterized protein LOC122567064 isoform X2 [Bombus pyrosoma]